ncbi:MAG: 4-hydroxyphenylacetate 3-hydroxylase N-terminal domain-containing protein [Bacillota bacterium]
MPSAITLRRSKLTSIFISHALQNPQLNRQKAINAIPSGYAGVHTIERNQDGIFVSGAKMVNTMAPIADDLLILIRRNCC